MQHRLERPGARQQADLFEPAPPRPRWTDLPHDVRTTVSGLVAQLLAAGWRHPLPTPGAEVEHE